MRFTNSNVDKKQKWPVFVLNSIKHSFEVMDRQHYAKETLDSAVQVVSFHIGTN